MNRRPSRVEPDATQHNGHRVCGALSHVRRRKFPNDPDKWRCLARPALGSGRCRHHGIGCDGSGNVKHGERSTTLRSFRDVYRAALEKPDYSDPRAAMALLDAIAERLTDLVDERDTPQFRRRVLELKLGMDKLLSEATLARRDSDAADARARDALQRAADARAAGDAVSEDEARAQADRAQREAERFMTDAREKTKAANEASRELTELAQRGASEADALDKLRVAADTLAGRVAELNKIQLAAQDILTKQEMVGVMSRILDVIYEEAGPRAAQRIAIRVRNKVFGGLEAMKEIEQIGQNQQRGEVEQVEAPSG